MQYGDEEMIRQRVAAKAKKRHSIHYEVEIDGAEYTFARREFALGFSMVVPETFQELSKETARRIFPMEDRPKIVLTNEDYAAYIAFNTNAAGGERIEERVDSYRGYMKRLNPANVFFTQGMYNLPNGMRIGYYDYQFAAVDMDMYNLTFVADVKGTGLLGWFICPSETQEKWEPLIRQMVQTIQGTSVVDDIIQS